jgi:hypothetical protein
VLVQWTADVGATWPIARRTASISASASPPVDAAIDSCVTGRETRQRQIHIPASGSRIGAVCVANHPTRQLFEESVVGDICCNTDDPKAAAGVTMIDRLHIDHTSDGGLFTPQSQRQPAADDRHVVGFRGMEVPPGLDSNPQRCEQPVICKVNTGWKAVRGPCSLELGEADAPALRVPRGKCWCDEA